ncbi:hypothetical protein [Sulfuricurvum sp.]|uniref:hypothetical protein n=1 Tax=Sulfuricurvum sp. TaxID=2025608 RepID=UPI002603CF63|nr:hypothetical protein [Sulfuricurvum sp.]MDD3596761.1 hypothetical protein [Sulfuricurvum sp.]
MPKFHTGLVITSHELEVLDHANLYKGVFFIPDPTKRHFEFKGGFGTRSLSCFELRSENKEIRKDEILALELILEASSLEEAKNDLSLIHAGLRLALPNPVLGEHGLGFPIELKDDTACILNSQPFWGQFAFENRLDVGLFTLSQAKNNRQYTYALEKYKFSLDLDCFTPHSGHPVCGQIFDNETVIYSTHVHQLAAVVSAYSVIEEMGCEIRASKEKPRFLESGEWNPDVWKETSKRLSRKNVDIDRKFTWIIRGDDTVIHADIPDTFGSPSQGYDGKIIKDKDMHIIEAIQVASWLRNMVASHKFGEYSSFISPYDVHNVQMLARRIIMECMGVLEYVEKSNELILK